MDLSKLSDKQLAVAEKVMAEANKQGIDPDWALNIAYQESKFSHIPANDPKSSAYGVMQINKDTAKTLGINARDEDQNIAGGVRYLKQHLDKFGGDKRLATVAYHDGPNSKFFKSGDMKDVTDEGLGYLQNLYDRGALSDEAEQSAQTDANAPPPEEPVAPEDEPLYSPSELANTGIVGLEGAAGGAALGLGSKGVSAGAQYVGRKLGEGIAEKVGPAVAQAVPKTPTGQIGTVPEAPALASGDKWSQKVVGSMGPGGESVTEAARNYRTQKGLSSAEAAQFKTDRSGIILPNKVAAQVAQESASAAAPAEQSLAKQLGGKITGAIENPLVKGSLGVAGKALGGAGIAIDTAKAFDEWKEGNKGKAALNALGAVGGAMTFLPGVGQAIGIPLSLLPAYLDYVERDAKRRDKGSKAKSSPEFETPAYATGA